MTLDSALTFASAMGEIFVFSLLMRNRVWRTFPMFCVYIAWTFGSDLAAFALQHLAAFETYVRFDIVEITIDSLLQFTVLVELAWSVLRPVRSSVPRSALLVLTLLIAVAGLVIWPLAGKAIPSDIGPESRLLFHVIETFAILRVACFVVMASFSQLLSIGWRDRELQIATGFGFYSIISLIVAVLHSHQAAGTQYHWLDVAESVSYLGTLSYWLYSFAAKEQERKEFSPQMQQLLLQLSGGTRTERIALTNIPSERPRKKD